MSLGCDIVQTSVIIWGGLDLAVPLTLLLRTDRIEILDRLDLAVLFTPSTPNRQNRNQVRWNTCAGARWSTPSSKVVQTERSRDLFQNKMAKYCLHCTEIFFRLPDGF